MSSDKKDSPDLNEDVSEDFSEEARRTGNAAINIAKKKNSEDEAADEIRRDHSDIIKRAGVLALANLIRFPELKWEPKEKGWFPTNVDRNRIAMYDLLFGNGDDRPHLNTFSGHIVDHTGKMIDDHYSELYLLEALAKMGLKGQSLRSVEFSFKRWCLAVSRNDLQVRIESKIPEWDNVERIENELIKRFECFDTPLNRRFGRYFWLSLYCRIMHPGCNAPMVLSLFGTQDAGKSYFSKLVCQEILGDEDADSIQLDLSEKSNEFLRAMTGNSVIASIGEMTGFNRGDLNNIKNFMTRTSDPMHYKYEGNFIQPRQWVGIMDGNSYSGFQRDDTGNRRFYPMFVGQLPDKEGQPHWKEVFKADFDGFAESVWMLLAECRSWLIKNGGIKAYNDYVSEVTREVAEFSTNEMKNDKGTIRDDDLDVYLVPALKRVMREFISKEVNIGCWITSADLMTTIKNMGRSGIKVNAIRLAQKMRKIGFDKTVVNNCNGYIMRDAMNNTAYLKKVLGDDYVPNEGQEKSADNGVGPF